MNIEINIRDKRERVKEKIDRDLYWYDNIKKEMMHFKGGQLKYEYKFDKYLADNNYTNHYRLLPTVENLEVVTYKKVSDYNKIKKWIKENNINIISEDNRSIHINISDAEKEDILDEIERKRFNYIILK